MLALLFAPPNTPLAGVDLAQVIGDLLPTLGASSLADLNWCMASELYQWADDSAKRLARKAGVFVERDTSISVANGVAVYPLPARHVDTIHVSIGGVRMRPASVQDLEALDSTWPSSSGIVERYSMDADGMTSITLYRIPTGAGAMAVIFNSYPATIAAGSSLVSAASPVADYFMYAMLAEARRKQSEGAMPEMAEHFDQRVGMYEEIFKQYFGGDE